MVQAMAAGCLRLVALPRGLTDPSSSSTVSRLSSGSGSSSSSVSSSSSRKDSVSTLSSHLSFVGTARLSECSRCSTRGMSSWGPIRALLDGNGFQVDAKAGVIDAGSIPLGVDWSKFGLWRWKVPATVGVGSAVLAGDESVTDEEEEITATILDGKEISAQIKAEVAAEVGRMRDGIGKVPGLAVVLVGTRKDSETYVRSKKKACAEVGIQSYGKHLAEDASEDEIVKAVEEFNTDPNVHGVLVQLPLPQHVNEERVLASVSEHKDVDGFNPLNIGRLAMQRREPMFVPCTPLGCVEILQRSGVQIAGKRAVVLGRSNIVGMPAALLLQRLNATVTIVHSQTPNPEEITRTADIVISAVGIPELVRGHWLKPGAVVIDVGINPVDDPTQKRGYRLVGDVCFEEAIKVARAVTPVPGGVGPMTIAILLQNTLCSAKRAFGLPER